MKRIFYLLLTIISINLQAQNSLLEAWEKTVNETDFHKIEINENGIYKVSYDLLKANSFPVDNINMSDLRLFRRGEEVAIKIDDFDNDDQFDPEDFILFYGVKNDSKGDDDLFLDPNDNINPFVPFFSNQSAYFLNHQPTSSVSLPKRILKINNTSSDLEREAFHWKRKLILFQGEESGIDYGSYSLGIGLNRDRTVFSSLFNEPRGWSSYSNNRKKTSTEFSISLEDLYYQDSIIIKTRFRNQISFTNNIEYFFGESYFNTGVTGNVEIQKYGASNIIQRKIPYTMINSETLDITVEDLNSGDLDTQTNQFGIVYFDIFYPQGHYYLNPDEEWEIYFKGNQERKISIYGENDFSTIWEVTNPSDVQQLELSLTDGSMESTLPKSVDSDLRQILYVTSYKQPLKVTEAQFTYLENLNSVDYLLITHQDLHKSHEEYTNVAEAYADYRKSVEGGSHQVLHTGIEHLINTFSFGDFSSLGIKRIIDKLKGEKLKYVALVGKAINHYALNMEEYKIQQVPSIGYPMQDQGYVFNEDSVSVSLGRIPASTAEELYNYLDKLKTYESLKGKTPQRKKILHLSGGYNEYEQEMFFSHNESCRNIVENSEFGGKVTNFTKEFDDEKFADDINEGVGIVNIFCHGSSSYLEMDIGFPNSSNYTYENEDNYPFFIVNGCGAGYHYYSGNEILADEWVLAPKKGAIGFLAPSILILASSAERINTSFYTHAFDTIKDESIGEVMVDLQNEMKELNNERMESSTRSYGLIGDPAISFDVGETDYWIDDISIENLYNQDSLVDYKNDTIQFYVSYGNLGKLPLHSDKNLMIQASRIYDSGEESTTHTYTLVEDSLGGKGTVLLKMPQSEEDKKHSIDKNTFTFTISKYYQDSLEVNPIEEYDLTNNTKSIFIDYGKNKEEEIPEIVGIEDDFESPQITIYPNPTNNNLHIKGLGNKMTFIRVIGLDGKVYLENTSIKETTTLELSFLNRGIYFLHVQNEEMKDSFKIIKN